MIDPPPERITWYYGEWQAAYENLNIPDVRLEEGLPTSFDSDGKRGLVVLDDLRLRTSILPDDAHQFVYVPKLCRKV